MMIGASAVSRRVKPAGASLRGPAACQSRATGAWAHPVASTDQVRTPVPGPSGARGAPAFADRLLDDLAHLEDGEDDRHGDEADD
jgi:hypothetical protein